MHHDIYSQEFTNHIKNGIARYLLQVSRVRKGKGICMKKIIYGVFAVLLSAAVFVSCNLSGTESDVSLSVTGSPDKLSSSVHTAQEDGSVTVTDGTNILVINKVEMVLFEINLGAADSMDSEDLEAGPILMELPLDGSLTPLFQALTIPPGSYEELEIEVKIPEGHEYEDDFSTLYPDWDVTVSIRVEGTFNDESFEYTQDFNDDFELEFENPLEVFEGSAGIILAIDVGTWFWNAEKTELLDPRSPVDFDRSIVEANIEDSFEAFEDSQELD